MARIPDFQSLGTPPAPRADLTVAGYPAPTGYEGASGQYLEKSGQVLDSPALRLERAAGIMQERIDNTRAEDAVTKLREWQGGATFGPTGFMLMRGADAVTKQLFKTYSQQFADQVNQISSGLGNDLQREAFNLRAGAVRNQFQDDLLRHIDQQTDIYHKQVLTGTIDLEARDAANHWTQPDSIRGNLARINSAIDDEAQRMGTPAQDVEATKLKAASAVHGAIIHQALAVGQTDYAMQWFADHAKELDPGHQGSLLEKIVTNQHMQMSRAISLQNHLDSFAARQLKDYQGKNEAAAVASTMAGKFLPITVKADMVAKQQITPQALSFINGLEDRRLEGHDVPAVSVALWAKVNSPDANVRAQAAQDVYAASAQGMVKGTQAGSMIQTLAARGREDQRQVQTDLFNTLKTALSGHALERNLVDLSDEHGQAQAARWTQAQQEWTQRTVLQKQDPSVVLQDMLPRYQPPVRTLRGFSESRFGQVNSLDDVEKVGQLTKDALVSGTISQDTYNYESTLLGKKYRLLLENEKRAAARSAPGQKAQPGGSVKVIGVQPGGNQ